MVVAREHAHPCLPTPVSCFRRDSKHGNARRFAPNGVDGVLADRWGMRFAQRPSHRRGQKPGALRAKSNSAGRNRQSARAPTKARRSTDPGPGGDRRVVRASAALNSLFDGGPFVRLPPALGAFRRSPPTRPRMAFFARLGGVKKSGQVRGSGLPSRAKGISGNLVRSGKIFLATGYIRCQNLQMVGQVSSDEVFPRDKFGSGILLPR